MYVNLCRITNFTSLHQVEHVMFGKFPNKLSDEKISVNILFMLQLTRKGLENLAEVK